MEENNNKKKKPIIETDYSMEGWANIPDHLLDLVVQKISVSTEYYVNLAATCAKWNYIVKSKKPSFSWDQKIPKLLFPALEHNNVYRLYDVTSGNYSLLNQPITNNNRDFCDSLRGWLIFCNNDSSVTLQRPDVTGSGSVTQIDLPCLFPDQPQPIFGNHITKFALSRDECVLAVMYHDLDKHGKQLAYIRLGAEEQRRWTKVNPGVEEHIIFRSDIVFSRNKFYTLTLDYRLVSFDPAAGGDDDPALIAQLIGVPFEDELKIRYLASSGDGELLMVSFHVGGYYDRTYKFDERNEKWVEMASLGDVALFLGTDHSATISCQSPSSFGFKPNYIYYLLEDAYRVGNLRIQDFTMREHNLGTNEFNSLMCFRRTNQDLPRPVWHLRRPDL